MSRLPPENSNYDAKACFRLAPYCEERGEFAKAADLYEDGIAISAVSDIAANNESVESFRQEVTRLRALASADIDGFTAARHRGVVASRKERYDDAIIALEEAIEIRSDEADLYTLLFQAYKFSGQYDKLDNFGERLSKVEPETPRQLIEFAYHYKELMELQKALTYATRVVEESPEDLWALVVRANVNLRLGNYNAAADDLRVAQATGIDESLLCQARAFLHFYSEQYNEALTAFECVLQQDPTNPYFRIWLYLARSYADMEDDEMLEAFYKGMNVKNQVWASALVAYCLGRIDAAALIAAATVEGDNNRTNGQLCEGWFYIGILAARHGDEKAARQAFEKCISYRIGVFFEHGWAEGELRKLNRKQP